MDKHSVATLWPQQSLKVSHRSREYGPYNFKKIRAYSLQTMMHPNPTRREAKAAGQWTSLAKKLGSQSHMSAIRAEGYTHAQKWRKWPSWSFNLQGRPTTWTSETTLSFASTQTCVCVCGGGGGGGGVNESKYKTAGMCDNSIRWLRAAPCFYAVCVSHWVSSQSCAAAAPLRSFVFPRLSAGEQPLTNVAETTLMCPCGEVEQSLSRTHDTVSGDSVWEPGGGGGGREAGGCDRLEALATTLQQLRVCVCWGGGGQTGGNDNDCSDWGRGAGGGGGGAVAGLRHWQQHCTDWEGWPDGGGGTNWRQWQRHGRNEARSAVWATRGDLRERDCRPSHVSRKKNYHQNSDRRSQ